MQMTSPTNGDGLVVSVFAYDSDDSSSSPSLMHNIKS